MKNLLGRLMSRPFDELKAISDAWATLTRDPNPTQNDLAIAVYHTMTEPSAVRGVWESLDPEAQSFMRWLQGQRNMLALVDDLPAHLDRPPDEVTPLLNRIRRLGLVDVDEVLVRGTRVVSSGDNLYSWAARSQPEATRRRVVSLSSELAKVLGELIAESKQPPPFDDPFVELLGRLDQEIVQKIAASWKLPEASRYYKSELIGVMTEFLATGQGRDLLLKSLSPASQKLFEFLEGQDAKTSPKQVRAHLSWDNRELRAALIPLVQRALVWDALSGDRRYLFVPNDLRKGGQVGKDRMAALFQPKLQAPAPITVDARLPYELTWDMLTLLASAGIQEFSLTLQDGRVTKRLAKKLNETFLHPADLKEGTDYIDMAIHLARSLGLLTERGGEQPVLAPSDRIEEWAKLTFDSQRRRIFAFWQEDRKWSEPATYGTIYWWNSDLTGARKRLVAHLSDLPVGEWISIDAFLRRVHMSEPFIIWSQDELVKRFGLRALQGFRSHWFDIEGRIIADMLKTVLLWLGAVDIGRDKQRRTVSFRVTEEGKHLFDPARATDTAQRTRTLLVQPNFEVLVLQPESLPLWNLIRISELVRHDRVSAYLLTKESVLRGVEAGLSAEAIQRFLHSNTDKALPQNVTHTIADWGRSVKRAQIRRATLIEVDDPVVLDELLAARKTRKLVERRLSPTAAIVNLTALTGAARDDPWQKLVKELRGAGYVATYSDESALLTLTSDNMDVVRSASVVEGAIMGRKASAIRADRTVTTRRTKTSNGDASNDVAARKTGTDI